MKEANLQRYREELSVLVSNVKALSYPRLGPQFKSLAPNVLHEALVAHRLLKTYEVPSASASVLRRDVSIMEVLHRDASGPLQFRLRDVTTPGDLYRARAWLHEFFRGFKHQYSARFPRNETYVSSFGNVDLYYKLSSAEQWHISPDLVSYATKIILRDRGLGSVVRARFRSMHGNRGVRILRNLTTWLRDHGENLGRIRYEAFRFMLRATCLLTRVSRVTTVHKDNDRDRVITCECLWTMVCQLSFSLSLRSHMAQKLGIDLSYLQTVHRSLIRAGGATIDLSKASDSNYMCVLSELWPEKVYKFLESVRTGIFETKDDNGDAVYTPLRMFAPMGCGCTFEVMTLTLLSHARVLDPGATVFGDDIIIAPSVSSRFIENITKMGWVVNESKSFVDGPFRESCGSYADLRTGKYLLSYDFRYPRNGSDAEILYRKVWNIGCALPPGSLRDLFAKHTATVLPLFPSDAYQVNRGEAVDLGSYGLPIPIGCAIAKTSVETSVTRLIAGFYQRPVQVRQHQEVGRMTRSPKRVCPTLTYCFLRRGGSYELPLKEEKVRQYPIDVWTGTPIRSIVLANVITT